MYTFRPFCNSDPPRLAEIWRDQPPQRGVLQPVTSGLLEQLVFSKPYFDPAGLIVATHGGAAVGFVHTGFGPNDEQSGVTTEVGTTHLLMLRSGHRQPELADGLLLRGECYLRERGAKVLYAGGIRPLDGFYLGFYGGSEMPGVLVGDVTLQGACGRCGYREIDRVAVLQLELTRFRAPFSRSQRQLRRETIVREAIDPPITSWWDAYTTGAFDRLRYAVEPTAGGAEVASVWFWDIEPLSSSWGIPTMGMRDLKVAAARRRQGLATHLLGDAFARLAGRGIVRVEAQTMRGNARRWRYTQSSDFSRWTRE